MTRDDEFIGRLEGYLDEYEGVTPLPEAVRHAVRLELPATQQNGRSFRFVRMVTMSAPVRFAVAAVVIAVIAFIGIKLLPSVGFIGGPTGSTAGSPSATPQSDPGPTEPEVDPLHADYSIGRHTVTVDGIAFSFEISAPNWEPRDGLDPANEDAPIGGLSINKNILAADNGQQADAILYWVPFEGDALARPCAYLASLADPSNISDIAAAVAEAPGTQLVATPSPVTVGGASALKVVISVRRDLGCDTGYLYSFGPSAGGAMWLGSRVDDTISVWIIDVRGRHLLLVGETRPNAGSAVVEEIQRIVDSIEFD